MTRNLKKMLSAVLAIIMLTSITSISICSAAELSTTIKREDNSVVRVDLDTGEKSTDNKVFTYSKSGEDFSCDVVFASVFTIADAFALKTVSFQADNCYFEKANNTIKAYAIPGNVVNVNDYSATAVAIKNSVQIELGSAKNSTSGSGINLEIPLDVSLLEDCIDENGKVTIIIRVENYNATRTSVLGNTISTSTSIKLNAVYESKEAQFYGEKSAQLFATNPIAINKDTSEISAISSTGLLYLRNEGTDNLLFITFDLTGVDKDNITSAVLDTSVWRNAGDQKIKATEVTTAYSEVDRSFTLSDTAYAISTACPYQNYSKPTTVDLTTIIKNATGNSITLCIQSEGSFTGMQQIAVTSEVYDNPIINVEYKNEILQNLDNISNYTEIAAKRVVIEGEASNPITAVPIVALYDGDQLVTVKIGDNLTFDGSLNTITESVAVPATWEFTEPKVSMFVWTSLSELEPVLDANSIE